MSDVLYTCPYSLSGRGLVYPPVCMCNGLGHTISPQGSEWNAAHSISLVSVCQLSWKSKVTPKQGVIWGKRVSKSKLGLVTLEWQHSPAIDLNPGRFGSALQAPDVTPWQHFQCFSMRTFSHSTCITVSLLRVPNIMCSAVTVHSEMVMLPCWVTSYEVHILLLTHPAKHMLHVDTLKL